MGPLSWDHVVQLPEVGNKGFCTGPAWQKGNGRPGREDEGSVHWRSNFHTRDLVIPLPDGVGEMVLILKIKV